MIESVKLLGAIAGLATAAFIILDRLLQGRPIAYVVASGNPTDPRYHLRVENASNVGILITDITMPHGVRVWRDDSTRSAIAAEMQDTFLAELDKGEVRDFPFLVRKEAQVGRLWLFIHWRRRSATWMPLVPKIFMTNSAALGQLAKSMRKT